MLSLVRKLSRNINSSKGFLVSATINRGITGLSRSNRYISTSEKYRNVYKIGENSNIVGGLALDLINNNKVDKLSRQFSTLESHSVMSTDEMSEFQAVFPDILRDLTVTSNKYNPSQVSDWFTRSIDYNLPRKRNDRALLTVMTYKNLVKSQGLTPENLKLAHILAWCVEILNAFFLVNDDIMDNSATRRGKPCWYKVDNVGVLALNDAIMMENGIYVILKKYFRNNDCYLDLMELFHEITFITASGQCLDMLNAKDSVSSFTMDKYKTAVANKTAYYTFYFPVAVAMHLAGIKDPEAFRQAKKILLEMGHFYQVQDDFLDCFGSLEITGKVGTDIQDNKCSWLAVVCMQRANEHQKQIMLECYGKDDLEKVETVKELYRTLDLPNEYAIYEEDSYNKFKYNIQHTSLGIPHEISSIFFTLLPV